jgi:lysophospholipase L1-like esterase
MAIAPASRPVHVNRGLRREGLLNVHTQAAAATAVVAAAAAPGMLANWFATIRRRTSLLWADGVHPQPRGAAVYAHMLAGAVRAAATIG